MTLRIEAGDLEGDQLLSRWLTDDGGAFSTEEWTEMQWDADNEVWFSLHEWAPPYGASPGQQYYLHYEVSDQRGGLVTGHVGITGKIEVLPKGRIVFTADPENDGNIEICAINADGTDFTNLTKHPDRDREPQWSPDGARIAFASNRDGYLKLFSMNPDGSQVEELFDPPAHGLLHAFNPSFDPSGSRLAFTSRVGSDWNVYVVNVDGTEPVGIGTAPSHPGVTGVRQLGSTTWVHPAQEIGKPRWDPSGSWVLLEAGPLVTVVESDGSINDYPADLYLIDVASGDWHNLSNTGGSFYCCWPNFVPNSSDILFEANGPSGEGTYRATLITSPPSITPPARVSSAGPHPSPDGLFVLDHGWGHVDVSKMDGTGRKRLVNFGRGGPMWGISY